jgi:addiction module HigA family antidote
MSTIYTYNPNYAIHPGETLKEALEERQMSSKEFSIRTGKPVKTISEIINAKSGITSEMAVRFEKVLNISANFWIKKQANYNEFIAKEKYIQDDIQEAKEWARLFPYPEMVKLGLVKATRKIEEKTEELLDFFNVSKHTAWENIYFNQQAPVYFRISLLHTKNPYALSVLLQMGKIEAKKINAPEYNKSKLKKILPKLKEIMSTKPDRFLQLIQKECLSAGVKVIYTVNLKNTVTNGVVRWIDNNPVIQMTDRHKRYDIFWFSLFHELGHVILHGNKKDIFLEEKNTNSRSEREDEADAFSSEFLLKEDEYKEIIFHLNQGEDLFQTIDLYSKEFSTHRDIIIGRILRRNKQFYKLGIHKEINRVDFKELIR